jgi:hypothetical protein
MDVWDTDFAAPRPIPGLGQYGGLWEFAAEGAMEAYKSSQEREDGGESAANTSQSEGMPGTNKSVPRQPSALSTIATNVVTQVSPQISPVMTQQQSSPGATVGANPTQFMPGGLSAETALSPFGNYGAPGMPTNQPGISPYQPYTMDPMTGRYVPMDPMTGQPIRGGYLETDFRAAGAASYSPVSVGQSRMTDIPWLPIALVGGGLAVALLLGKRKRK